MEEVDGLVQISSIKEMKICIGLQALVEIQVN